MAKQIYVYDGQYATSDYESKKGKIVFNCIKASDIYFCGTNVKSADNGGIIAGIGNNNKIKFLVQVDLNKDKQRALVNVTSLNQVLSVPAPDQTISLSNLSTKKMYSLDVSYKFGKKIENELKSRHNEYYLEELKKIKKTVLNIAKQTNNPHTKH